MDAMDFEQALAAVKNGRRARRREWDGTWILLVAPSYYDVDSRVPVEPGRRRPWLGLRTPDGGIEPWTASHADLLADDWSLAGFGVDWRLHGT